LENGEPGLRSLRLVACRETRIEFDEGTFELSRTGHELKIALDAANHVTVSHKDQRVHYKATVLGGSVLQEDKKGQIDYSSYFSVDWEDALHVPVLRFLKEPRSITRSHDKGQRIELGAESVSLYHLVYHDGVVADFERTDGDGFRFSFSTGFEGSFWEEDDGSYVIRFKGDRLQPGEDDFQAQSKFVISRSKYSGKPLLILQDDATVELR
jgi:hypothetical protein